MNRCYLFWIRWLLAGLTFCPFTSSAATIAFEGVISRLSGNTAGYELGQAVSGTYYIPDGYLRGNTPSINLTTGSLGWTWIASTPTLAVLNHGNGPWQVPGDYSGLGLGGAGLGVIRGFTTSIDGTGPDRIQLNSRGGMTSDFSVFQINADFPSSSRLFDSGLPSDLSSVLSANGTIRRNATDNSLDLDVEFEISSLRIVPEPTGALMLAISATVLAGRRRRNTALSMGATPRRLLRPSAPQPDAWRTLRMH